MKLLFPGEVTKSPSPSYLGLFLQALKNPHSYNPLSNGFFWFGFLWGIPVPVVMLWFHYHLKGLSVQTLFLDEPIQFFFVLHPFLFGFLFGLMGSMVQHYVGRLRRESIRDGLTGLYDHRYFRNELKRRINEAERYDFPFCLVMFDIDHFKKVNDQFGHQAGDRVLKRLGELFTGETREADIVCRYGGEEFGILLPATDLDEACELSERIRMTIENRSFEVNRPQVGLNITISGGVAEFPSDETTETGLIKVADERLYQAKESGRNQIIPDIPVSDCTS